MIDFKNIAIPKKELAAFCGCHHIRSMAFFGSVLRADFGPESDLDVLVEFEAGHMPGLSFFTMQDELSAIFGRRVDLNTPGSFGPALRPKILAQAEPIYG